MSRIQLQYLFQDRNCGPDVKGAGCDCLALEVEGCRLYGTALIPDGEYSAPRPCVAMFHGFPGFTRYDDLAQALCRVGCVTLMLHHRGAWGSEGKYLISHAIEDAVAIAEYIRGPEFSQKHNIDPEAVFLLGHSMGANTVIHAARTLPWLKGIMLLAPYDPIRQLENGQEKQLLKLLEDGEVMNCDGVEALFQDLSEHREQLGFENAAEYLKYQNVFCAVGKRDKNYPAEEMIMPLWRKLQKLEGKGLRRLVEYSAGHGLMSCRCALAWDTASFIADALKEKNRGGKA